jgi:RNA polymerase sigma-70 factor (ECF subfamily)
MKKHTQDLEDAVSQTFLKLLLHDKPFENKEHEKAWLIFTASNVCRNMISSAWKRKVRIDSEYFSTCTLPFDIDETIAYVMALPDKYKAAIYLHYYEGYSAAEIGRLINKSEASVWGYLHEGRKLLKVRLTEV